MNKHIRESLPECLRQAGEPVIPPFYCQNKKPLNDERLSIFVARTGIPARMPQAGWGTRDSSILLSK